MTDEVRMIARPLVDWPGRLLDDADRKGTPFRATWTDTTDLLARETAMLGGREVIVQLAVKDRDVRVDGWIRADARPKHPGVTVVVPESGQGRVSFSTDRYAGGSVFVPQKERRHPDDAGMRQVPGWQANVRAIALSMQALRAADRHGIMQGRQYAGFRELPAGTPMGAGGQMTADEAARFLAEHAAVGLDGGMVAYPWGPAGKGYLPLLADPAERSRAYRLAVLRLHPDGGGDSDLFRRLVAARTLLDEHAKAAS